MHLIADIFSVEFSRNFEKCYFLPTYQNFYDPMNEAGDRNQTKTEQTISIH